MTEDRRASSAQTSPVRPVDVWLGTVFFGLGNFVVLFFFPDFGLPIPLLGVAYAALVAGFTALVYFVAGWRGFAIGIVLGFILMTLSSGGACTLFTFDPYFGSESGAFAIYPLAVVAGGIGVAIHAAVQRARRSRRS